MRIALILSLLSLAAAAAPASSFPNGLPPETFPIAVWLQSPHNAPKYKALGINLYVGLWKGPTEDQLAALEKAGMPVICHQSEFALKNKDRKIIVGYMHGDEPDNAQPLPDNKGYGPPILPEKIIADYQRLHAADPTRPVLLNLGQAVAYDNYIGRGTRRNHPEDYAQYVKGCDIASFDIYPANHDQAAITGHLEFVAKGAQRLRTLATPEQKVWTCIECTGIRDPRGKPTPEQVKSEVWLAITHGSTGLIYFCHQFKPTSNEAALLADPAMSAAVKQINAQITKLAPVLMSATVPGAATCSDKSIAILAKRHDNALYLLTVNTTDKPAAVIFNVDTSANHAEVIDEDHAMPLVGKTFTAPFQAYQVHLYRFDEPAPAGPKN